MPYSASYSREKKKRWLKIGGVIIICLTTLSVPLGVTFYRLSQIQNKGKSSSLPSGSAVATFKKAAVSSNVAPCSTIGRDVLAERGSAVDAAIATAFCIGVVNPQSAGIGGGFFMTIYDAKTKITRCLDARETAPAASTEDMFHGNLTLSKKGGLSVAVPGAIAGYWAAHQAHGKLPWSRLVTPAADLAEKGVPVNFNLAKLLLAEETNIKADQSMKLFLNEEANKVLKEGDTLKMPQLTKTLRLVAHEGIDVFYNGSIGDQLVEDVQRRGGILSKENLFQYRALWANPVKVELKGNLTLFSSPPPGSGVLVAYIMKILDEMGLNELGSKDPLTYHRVAEAFKHAYAQRTKLGDPRFMPGVTALVQELLSESNIDQIRTKMNDSSTFKDSNYYRDPTYYPEDSGTSSHVSVIDANGMTVSLTSTMDFNFGTGLISEGTGILLNNAIGSFSFKNTSKFNPSNAIRPGKRPFSFVASSIVAQSDTGKVRLVIGSTGGTRAVSSTAYVMIRHLLFGEDLKKAIDSPRIHLQQVPSMTVKYERGFPQNIIDSLITRGHTAVASNETGSSVCGIQVRPNEDHLQAVADHRQGGAEVDGID